MANDRITAEFALDQGIPCVVDNLMPTLYADSRTGASKAEGFNPVVNKWLWAQQLLQMDYTILFLDWDVSVLKVGSAHKFHCLYTADYVAVDCTKGWDTWVQNPLEHLDLSYDLQGLSNFHNAPKHVGKLRVHVLLSELSTFST